MTYNIHFSGREAGAIGKFEDMHLEVKTPYSFLNNNLAIMAINSAGYEVNHILGIHKGVKVGEVSLSEGAFTKGGEK